jgi:hypothetical protein
LTKLDVYSRNYLTDEDAAKTFRLLSGTSEVPLHFQNDFLDEVSKQTDLVISATITSNLTQTTNATYGISVTMKYADQVEKTYDLNLSEITGNPYQAVGYHDSIAMLYSDSKVSSITSAKVYIYGFDETKTSEYVEFKNIKIGFVERTVASISDKASNAIADATTKIKSDYEQAIADATNLITGSKGGNVVIRKDEDGYPREILIMNTTDISTATRVWRWDAGGDEPGGVDDVDEQDCCELPLHV